MPTYTKASFTPSQTPVSEGGDIGTSHGAGMDVDGSGNLNSPAGWNGSYVLPAVDTWARTCYIEADVSHTGNVIGIGFLNDSGSSSQAAGLRFHLNGASSALLREYVDASSLEIYTSLPTPTWTGSAQKIGIELTDSATADEIDYQLYVDTGSGMAAPTTNGSGTITMQDAVTTLQPWLVGNNGGNITAFEARDEFAPSVTIEQADTTPEDGVLQTVTCTGMTGPITAATEGGYDILSLLSGTDPSVAITYTLDISAIEASQGAPRIGQTSTLSFTTATDGAITQDVTIQPKTGWAEVDLAGTLDKTANGFLATLDADLGLTSAVGDIIYYDATNNESITATGVYTSDLTTAGQFTEFVIQQGGSATVQSTSEGGAFYPYGEAGGSETNKLTARKLTSAKVTSTKLEASKL